MALITSKAVTSVSMEMRGLAELRRAMATMPDVVKLRLQSAVAASTFRLYNSIQTHAPQDTGTLKRSVAYRVFTRTGRVTISADGWYWHFLEYGTVKMPAQGWIRAAGEYEQPLFERGVISAGHALEQTWARVA